MHACSCPFPWPRPRACAQQLATTAEHLINRATFENVSPINTTPSTNLLPRGGEGGKETRLSPFSLIFFLPFFTSIFVTDQAEKERENTVYVNGLLKEDDAERYGMNGRSYFRMEKLFSFLFFFFPLFCKWKNIQGPLSNFVEA